MNVRVGLVALFILGGIVLVRTLGAPAEASGFRIDTVKTGDLLVSISATGTLEPEEVVDVGAQVAGRIARFGTDKSGHEIDYGSEVAAGSMLAQIDDSLYLADLAHAEAELRRARADFVQLQATFAQAERDWGRAQKLGTSDALSQTAFETYRTNFESAKAGLTVGEAGIAQADAALTRAKRNLEYATILSPVDGVIIDRRVNIGQTVVASLNAPSLFLIAKDLKRMEVWVSVNEADIGNIHPGQAVSFTVDAFPGETFRGEVGKIRLNASMTQNVVTYIVEVHFDNSSGKLLPYLTANVRFEVQDRKGVLLVPNSALRWTPPAELVAGDIPSDQRDGPKATASMDTGKIWVADGEKVRAVEVTVGGSDGSFTEIRGSNVTDGLSIVTGLASAQQVGTASGTTNPFAPQLRRGRNRSQ